jgi:hypothetical protein
MTIATATARLQDLRAAQLPHATFDALFSQRGDGEPWSDEDKAPIDVYLSGYWLILT